MILVTGASGFVGQHLIRKISALHPDTAIRAVDVQPGRAQFPASVAEWRAPIEDTARMRKLVQGADVVVHLAARVEPGAVASQALWNVNVSASSSLYSLAVAAGCNLFVHLSSAGIYGAPCRTEPFVETDLPRPTTPYQHTKWEAEQRLLDADPRGTTLNILRPAGIYGPGSRLELDEYRRVKQRRLSIELRGGVVVHPTHVDDVVHAIVAILDRPAPRGSVFNIGGERPLLLQELRAIVATTLGVARRRIVVPPVVAWPAASVAERFLAGRGLVNPRLVEMSRGVRLSAAVDDSRFRARYPNVPVTPLEQGLRAHLDWAVAEGLL